MADVHRPVIPDSRHFERAALAQALLAERGVAGLLVGVGADLRYLTGYAARETERLTMLVLPAVGRPSLVVPRLEAMAAASSPGIRAGLADLVPWDETDDAHELVAARLGAVGQVARARLLVSDRLWAMHVLGLRRVFPGATLGLASEVLRELRMVKDPDEVALLRLAAHAADRVVARIAAGRLVGRTELDVSREVRDRLVAEGHETAEFAIVASGPNSASPHHDAGERVIRAGEPIVLDIGGSLGGYGSDTTRTLWVTGGDAANGPTPEFRALFDLLRDAQAQATSAVRPGVPCERIDAVARGIIAAGGHGPDFIHRVGHGIGLETHEEPYMVAGNAEPLRPGMAFSVEPGIYVAGRHGARIEDIVVCGPDGPDVLNESSRDLWVVPG
ncbi:MAG TPA: Xaa-Pro peptidase family protein [Candidatus Sulfomarinibacteraceae bacterium]|nr:Xaa-Pro peptidase family protein [Candidatus Sulfomarinibacteraceae bacterium]